MKINIAHIYLIIWSVSYTHLDVYKRQIIEGINADENHIFEILKLIKNTNIKKINLLPYHDIAMHKYEKLGRKYYEYMKRPADEKLKRYKGIFEKEGYRVKIGG